MNKIAFSKQLIAYGLTLSLASLSHAATVSTELYTTNGNSVGNVVFVDTKYGLMITPNLIKLPAGLHGFHIHEMPDCGNHAMNAGGHLDPDKSNSHQGPYGQGHLGDLPVLVVDSKGAATTPVLAPRLKTQDIQGHALMVHAGGDNYSDHPKLGGGGDRIACGKINAQ